MDATLGSAVTVSASTERWFSEVAAGRAFAGYGSRAASVGNYCEVQLWNPVGSNVTMLPRSVVAVPGVSAPLQLGFYDTQLATAGQTGRSLLSGGTAAQGLIRTAAPAAQDGTFFHIMYTLANTPLALLSDWGAQLSAGQGLIVVCGSTNVELTAYFDWIET